MNTNAYSEFAQLLKTKLEQSSTRGLSFSKVLKNNDTLFDIVSVKDTSLAPIVYLQEFFHSYKHGCNIEEITSKILQLLNSQPNHFDVEIPNLASYATISANIFPVLVNLDLNRKRLKNIPYSVFLDLAVTYKIFQPITDGITGLIEINNTMISTWGISVEELHKTAMKNLRGIPFSCSTMSELLVKTVQDESEISSEELSDVTSADNPLLVLSAEQTYTNGATVLLSTDTFYEALNKYFPSVTTLLILPSSINEVLAIPYPEKESDISYFREVVQSANQSGNITPEEILNDKNLYCYNSKTNKIELVKEQEDKT
ncbi:MAG: hypothetical protein E7261_10960 [Lachnospiraceae bacterium]|nr:hypothetical protein [Lachnospiraceae bacterium]